MLAALDFVPVTEGGLEFKNAADELGGELEYVDDADDAEEFEFECEDDDEWIDEEEAEGPTPARNGEPRSRGGTGPSRLRGALMGEMFVWRWLFGIVVVALS